MEGFGKLPKIHIIVTRTRDLPACSTVPQPNTLRRVPVTSLVHMLFNKSEPSLEVECDGMMPNFKVVFPKMNSLKEFRLYEHLMNIELALHRHRRVNSAANSDFCTCALIFL
jgi:hypothetical protein